MSSLALAIVFLLIGFAGFAVFGYLVYKDWKKKQERPAAPAPAPSPAPSVEPEAAAPTSSPS